MVAMEHVESACSLTLFLVIYLLTSNGIRNFGALATQGEQKKCSYHFEGKRKKDVITCFELSFCNLIKFICLKTCSFLVQLVESLNP